MTDRTMLRERFLQDSLPAQLGNLASNLDRIKSQSIYDEHPELVENVIEESMFFIEWTATELAKNDSDIDTAAELVELQVQLARWQYTWKNIWGDPARRNEVAERSGMWSQRVVEMSDLLRKS